MKGLQIFENVEFGQIRMVTIDGEPWFVAVDIATALGYATPRDAVARHCKGVVKHDTPTSSGIQSISYINEGDMYRLIMRSKLPSAEKFEDWVVNEILPSIRKHGAYMTADTLEKALSSPDFLIQLATKLKEEKERNAALLEDVSRMKPKEIFADAVSVSNTSILIGELAKILKQNGVDIGQNRLFGWMRDNGYLIKRKGTDYNMPMQKSMEMGLFEIKERTITNPDGSVRITKTVLVTGKGQQYFINKFLAEVA